jgi:D-alanyl-D-alanine carboxypeptidase
MPGWNSAGRKAAIRLVSGLAILVAMSVLSWQPSAAATKYAAIVVDGNTGKVLHEENADEPRYPASLTKIMTLYILFDYLDKKRLSYNDTFYVTPNAAAQPPSKLGLKVGEKVTVYNLVGALVTKSANDAAATIAENIAGSVDKFARLMNSKAKALGMTSTNFKNASGLPDPEQRTSARDMARLSMRIMNDFPKYATFFKLKTFTYQGRSYRNHNTMLFSYQGMEGIKTGYTRDSGFNLTTSVRRGDKHLIAVVLGGKTAKARNADMARLLNANLPRAASVAKRRPLEQRIAQLDPQPAQPARSDSPRYTSKTQPSGNWKRPVPIENVVAASETAVRPAPPADSYARQPADHGFDIQIGAYTSRDEAITNLTSTQSAANSLLDGHHAYIMAFEKDGVNYSRARFAGFASRESAQATCSKLKRKLAVNCLVMAP